jgi:hypothetical protein
MRWWVKAWTGPIACLPVLKVSRGLGLTGSQLLLESAGLLTTHVPQGNIARSTWDALPHPNFFTIFPRLYTDYIHRGMMFKISYFCFYCEADGMVAQPLK